MTLNEGPFVERTKPFANFFPHPPGGGAAFRITGKKDEPNNKLEIFFVKYVA